MENIYTANDEKNIVKILWTGGFDSSYRMVQLSKFEVTVQPFYLSDERISEKNELKAIEKITEDIRKNPETKCTILPLKMYKVTDIEADKEITNAYKSLREEIPLGIQYDWLPRFAKSNPGLELCLEKAESSKAYKCIMKYGEIKIEKKGDVSYCVIDPDKSSENLVKIFGAFHFPLPLFHITKLETKKEYEKLGYKDTIQETWFCFNPINNQPCGICNPCKSVVEEGMSFRLSEEALKRYRKDNEYSKYKVYRYIKAVRRRIKGY